MVSKPEFPYENHIAEFDGVDIVHIAQDKDDWIGEDRFWEIQEAVNVAISEARQKMYVPDFDVYAWFESELEKIDTGLEMK